MTAVDVIRQRRPARGVPVFNAAYQHVFEPDGWALVTSQCVHCWGWYDDPRHRAWTP
mgnify:CR=1 FL=1